MGSAVSRSLASRGVSVLTVERYGLNHGLGSSHGKTRIIRQAYAEDPRYVPLVKRALASWQDLQEQTGVPLVRLTGGLMIGDPEGPLVRGTLRSARKHDLEFREMSGRELGEEFPALRAGSEVSAVHERTAGVLFAERCIQALYERASQDGCEFRFNEPLYSWRRRAGAIEVSTSNGRYVTDKLVICAGPWTGRVMGDALPLKCERQVPLWFDSGGNAAFMPGKMPIFVAEEGRRLFYGIPDFGDGVKVAEHHAGPPVDPDFVDRRVTDRDLASVAGFMKRRLPALDRRPVASTTCIYTNTPDTHFVIGPCPGDQGVLVVSACSGHGFKFASVIGEIAADLLIDGGTRYDIGFLGPGRFARGG